MAEIPRTRYVESSEGLHIAYQVVGDGPLDLALLPTNWFNVSSTGRTRSRPGSSVASARSAGVVAAGTYPARFSTLVLYNTFARLSRAVD